MRPTRNYVACGEHYYWMCVNARALPFILLHTALALGVTPFIIYTLSRS